LKSQILIVGAGPTGLVLAAELRNRGVNCRLVDKAAQASAQSRALAIHARTLEIFEKMGIISEVLKSGWQSQAFTVFAGKKQLVRMTFSELESSYHFVLSLPQTETERILEENFTKTGGIVERSTTLIGVIQNAQCASVQLKLPDGKIERTDFDFVIGCDGAHSDVRRLLEVDFPGSPYPEQYVLADIDFESSLNLTDHYVFSGTRGIAGFHPLSRNGARIFAHLGRIRKDKHANAEIGYPEPTLEELQSLIDERGPGNVTIKKLNWLSMHKVQHRQVNSYQQGRVFLAGDAAHIHSPTGGQGMNLGIQDAYNLAWKLALVQHKQAPRTLLSSYSEERHLVGKQVTVMSDLFTLINNVRSPLLQFIRNKLGPMLSKPEDIRCRYRNAVSGLSSNYRLSAIVFQAKSATDSPQAGDRMPDAMVVDIANKKSERLFELTSGHGHHLLLVQAVDEDEEALRIADKLETLIENDYKKQITVHRISFVDTAPLTHRLLDARDTKVYLIRPDGYIGYRSEKFDFNSLSHYLKRIFSL
jgi:2-polyprenyl-6-methoxyphenol hydroxylase-like FAD-dependent oxidoreductase